MKKLILIPGLIGGAIASVTIIVGTIYCYYTGKFEGNMLVGYASMILAFSMIFATVKQSLRRSSSSTALRKSETLAVVGLVLSSAMVDAWM